MALTARQMHYPLHHDQQQQSHYNNQQHQRPKNNIGGVDVKRTANMYVSKLSDRDTEAMAASELDSMARSLPADSIPSFLSAISDTRTSDKTPLRRHCVRLLSLLSQSHPPHSIAPLLPRMISSVRSRLRDPDSSVRSACVDAVRSISNAASSSSSSVNAVLRPLCESLLLEQDHNAQIGSAMCVAAAVEGLGFEVSADLQRLVPRLVKLVRSEAFKAKPALLTLFGCVLSAGGASTSHSLGILVPCLIDYLGSDDWATRKAAADALSRVATIHDTHLLASFKPSCISSYETRRFDKVKIVRDSMNQMLEAWKNLPSTSGDDDGGDGTTKFSISRSNSSLRETVASGGCFPSNSRMSSSVKSVTKNRLTSSRSPPPEASPIFATRRNTSPSTGKRTSPRLLQKLDEKKPSDWKIEISVLQANSQKGMSEDKKSYNEANTRYHLEQKQVLFENISEDKAKKPSNSRPSRAVPFKEKEISDSGTGSGNIADDMSIKLKENSDMSLIRNQLSQIENQQSSIVDLLQRFIGSSQNGIRALETRVHDLEKALDDISQDLAVSSRKMSDTSANACCKLPGADFLSSKFWRRTEGRYSSRFSISSSAALAGRSSADKESIGSFNWEKRQHGTPGGFIVNPLAEVNSPTGCTDISSTTVFKSAAACNVGRTST